jgi:hypothetical protein
MTLATAIVVSVGILCGTFLLALVIVNKGECTNCGQENVSPGPRHNDETVAIRNHGY